ncbi:sprouty-related, EVH1 domain-containing protein 2 [Octopus bimaculoides]|uniref:sprouty-related, EVH1 domain-containing protein 2 n=1 Tax=Octopus bimaculoides TaxID=37653 RepID=UPI00071D78DB|nr:sprouty-related, EVH1 domain-containing protein 2 [Octopus bimaculoides]|eukprot:XP_014780288.1 PREDICTED: sprouty-related, EVH1 domain-containing protein 2-like [Octopus bimaculoides]
MSDIDRNGDHLVRVRAQVMTRDDSSGGWVPLNGGGLSYVCLKTIPTVSNGSGGSGREVDLHNDYIIYGERIVDANELLSCTIKKDIQYTVVNPKFHHWRTDDKRFGLTFERSGEARAFNQGIKHVLADLTKGSVDPSNITLEGDDDVFEPIDLPLDRKNSSSQSASTTSTTTSSPALCSSPVSSTSPTHEHFIDSTTKNHLHRIYIPSLHTPCTNPASSPSEEKSFSKSDSIETSSFGKDDNCIKDEPVSISGKSEVALLEPDNVGMSDRYSYVTFSRHQNHDYHYPNLEIVRHPPDLKRHAVSSYGPPLPEKSKRKKDRQKGNHQSNKLLSPMSTCKYCQENFSVENNSRGSCQYAPDRVKSCIEHVSCVTCATGVIYHCMSDTEGEYTHTCICDFQDDNNCKKWTMLTFLSFLLPCIWCYWPLFSCHMCGKKSGCCGGRHLAGGEH